MTDHDCTPGARRLDRACTRHHTHYWCDACDGWYGVPHDGRCHTADPFNLIPGHTSGPEPGCACRACRTVRDIRGSRAYDVYLAAVEPHQRYLAADPQPGDLVRYHDTIDALTVVEVRPATVTVRHPDGTTRVRQRGALWTFSADHARPKEHTP